MFVDGAQFTDFEWDEAKRLSNIRKHGIDFVRVVRFLSSEHIVFASTRGSETRWRAICMDDAEVLTVVYVERNQTCRIISARRAHRSERRKHQAIFGQGD